MDDRVEVPFKDSSQLLVIELQDILNNPEDIREILQTDNVSLEYCLKVAHIYYEAGNFDAYRALLDVPVTSSPEEAPFQLAILNSLAAYFINLGLAEKDKTKSASYFEEATLRFNEADKIDFHEEHTWLGKGVLLLAKRNYESATFQFNTVLQKNPHNIPALLGQACISFQKGEYNDALQKYALCLRLSLKCPPSVRLALGYCYHKLGYVEEAKLCFKRALQLSSSDCNAISSLAVLECNTHVEKRVQHGLALLKKSYELNRTHPVTLNHLANYFFTKNEFAKCRALATTAFQNSDMDELRSESTFILGKLCHSEGRFDDAFHYYFQSSQLNPTSLLPLFGLAQMYIYKEENAGAIKCLERILESDKNNYECLKILGSLLSKNDTSSKEFKRALTLLQRVTELCPDDIEAWLEYAAAVEQSNPEAAIKGFSLLTVAYGEAIRQLRQNEGFSLPPEVLNNYGVLQFRFGNPKEAMDCVDEAISELKNHIDGSEKQFEHVLRTLRFNRGRCLESLGRLDEAEVIYKEILAGSPNYIDCHLRLGLLTHKKGNPNDATEHFKDAIGLNENSKDAWGLLGALQLTTKAITPSRKTFERILIKSDKHDVFSLLALGNIYYLISRHDSDNPKLVEQNLSRALEFFQKALSIDTRNFYAANGLGMVLAAKGYTKEAKEIFIQIRQAENSFDDVWVNLGHLNVELGQYSTAVNMYEHCGRIIRERGDPSMFVYLARAHYFLGKESGSIEMLSESIKNLEIALELNPQDLSLVFNIALNQQEIGSAVLRKEKYARTIDDLEAAVNALSHAAKTFKQLVDEAVEGQRYYDVHVAKHRAKYCETQREVAVKQLKEQTAEEATKQEHLKILAGQREQEIAKNAELERAEEEKQKRQEELIELQRQEAAQRAKEIREKIISAQVMEVERKKPKEREEVVHEPAAGEGKPKKRRRRVLRKKKEESESEHNEGEEDEAIIADLFDEEKPHKRRHLSKEIVSSSESEGANEGADATEQDKSDAEGMDDKGGRNTASDNSGTEDAVTTN